jgi:hypothetical protein
VEFLYNLPQALGAVTVSFTGMPLLGDGGPACPNLATAPPFEFTGVLPLLPQGNSMTFFEYVLP